MLVEEPSPQTMVLVTASTATSESGSSLRWPKPTRSLIAAKGSRASSSWRTSRRAAIDERGHDPGRAARTCAVQQDPRLVGRAPAGEPRACCDRVQGSSWHPGCRAEHRRALSRHTYTGGAPDV